MSYSIIPELKRSDNNGIKGFTFAIPEVSDNEFYKGLDNNADTHFRSSVSPKLPEYYAIYFPKAYAVSGYTLVFNSTLLYHQMSTWDFQGLVNGVWITLHSGSRTNKIETLTYTFSSIDVNGTRIKCKSRTGTNSWGFTDLFVYDSNSIAFIKKHNQYYTIKPDFYNSDTQMYTPVEDLDFSNAFLISDMFDEITIGKETFKPLDKFDDFKLIFNINSTIKVRGIKSDKELIVASGDIKISVADNIEYIKLLGNTSENSDIRIVFSKDKGETWYTYDGKNTIITDCIIPMKMYSDMSAEEKVKYNVSKDVIADIGMNIDMFNSFDFNHIDSYGIRFAYVITRPTYKSISEINDLSWKFNAKGYMKELKDTEYDLDVYNHRIQATSAISNDLIKVSVIT